MPKLTPLDRQWQQLIALCETESKLLSEGDHPRLIRHIASEIEQLAVEMGFSPRRIASRDFRAERDGVHIVSIVAD
jgi:hypothetical protein